MADTSELTLTMRVLAAILIPLMIVLGLVALPFVIAAAAG